VFGKYQGQVCHTGSLRNVICSMPLLAHPIVNEVWSAEYMQGELLTIYSSGISISPLSISSLTSFGLLPSTWQPTLNAVPRISLTPPFNSFDSDLNLIVRAITIISSSVTDLLCLMFFSFFRSRGGSFRALMTSEEADGTTETTACRFWMVSFTVTRRPFCIVLQTR